MKKLIALTIFLASTAAAGAQSVTCMTAGVLTTCSDGSSATQVGDMTVYSPSPSRGQQIFSPPISSPSPIVCSTVGDFTICK